MRFSKALFASLPALATAIRAPNIDGYKIVWEEPFSGCQGCAINTNRWNIIQNLDVNNEIQEYTTSNANLQLSGGDSLQIIPTKSSSGEWTSGRIESKKTWFAKHGRIMRVEAQLRQGESMNKQGMWPAFWMLGDAIRHGTEWPLCGELDIFERVNGDLTGYGTVHCGQAGGGPCDEPNGLGQPVTIPNNDFHYWALVVDRTSGNWQTETITWLLDGQPYHTLTGAELGDEGTWATLAHSPMYILLNVAVGGNWPGNPDSSTESGYGNMMEVMYVAVYEST
ncbi:concanavalin A-like lectin/glucanase domain-containing protein [Thelonectria olida]|uniref:Concanavalin A-like lectin/glucanase domain-containing protein n=1 Tax=Thelonectria olida TaxID=1576542 RepID=A0A9P8WFE3_9HYPO|nr:concanavalin A-like lectin/glucanase domain-containing protein [Thelonectria olida]